MNIVMLGAGYVGLVSGTCFANFGVNVTCVDPVEEKIKNLKAGIIPIYEPALDDLVLKNMEAERLNFATSLAECEGNIDAIFIAVGTPTKPEDGHADLKYVYQAARDIAAFLNPDHFTAVVNKSTVPIGTGREVEKIIREANPKANFAVVSNPEFLREGSAIYDFTHPDRIVIGTDSDKAASIMRELYKPVYRLEKPLIQTTLETAELTKYAGNAFLATKITFINEIADICEKVGANVQDVARGIGLDGRIGKKFLHAGPGYGGSCFPKDTLALVKTAQDLGTPIRIVETVVDVNKKRKESMAQRVINACDGCLKGKTVGILGVAFKQNTDDMRDSIALDMLPMLKKAGAIIQAFDPAAMKEAAKLLPNISWKKGIYDALQNADVAVILTEWDEFRTIDLARAKATMKTPIFVDLRNLYDPESMAKEGFTYSSIGRGSAKTT